MVPTLLFKEKAHEQCPFCKHKQTIIHNTIRRRFGMIIPEAYCEWCCAIITPLEGQHALATA